MKLEQRCHCTCDNLHYNAKTLCKNYSSSSIDIYPNTELYKLLFVNTNKNNKSSDYNSTVAYEFNIDLTAERENKMEIFNRLTNRTRSARPRDSTQPITIQGLENLVNNKALVQADDEVIAFTPLNSLLDSLGSSKPKQNTFLQNRLKQNKK